MKKYRFLFFLWLILWLAVWVFGNSNIGVYILSASILCAAIEVTLAYIVRKHISIQLTGEATMQKRAKTVLSAEITNDCFLGCNKLRVDVACYNMLTGKKDIKSFYTTVGGKSGVELELPFFEEYCGKLNVEVVSLVVYDIFGISGFVKHVDAKTALLVLPEIYPVEISSGKHVNMDMSSDEYSMLRPGDDPSETFALREYRPGDKIKNIHWKLSEKTGATTVRELGFPVNNSLLVLFDNTAKDSLPQEEMLELAGEMAISVSSALMSIKLQHDIAWLDREQDEVVTCHVSGEENLTEVMSGILSAKTDVEEQDALERFMQEHDISEFAHIIVISLNSGMANESFDNAGVTYICPSSSDKEGIYVEI